MILMYIRVPSAAGTVWQLEPIELIEGFLVSNHSKASVAMTGEYSTYSRLNGRIPSGELSYRTVSCM